MSFRNNYKALVFLILPVENPSVFACLPFACIAPVPTKLTVENTLKEFCFSAFNELKMMLSTDNFLTTPFNCVISCCVEVTLLQIKLSENLQQKS